MAASSLLALLDDIATVLDDVAAMTKTSAQKVSGVLGDDLALNAQQASGLRADREIPVVVAVGRGSLVNKMILVPAALLISALVPWLIVPLMILGGLYLCFEGAEKLVHTLFLPKGASPAVDLALGANATAEEMTRFEKEKVKGAIRTDFVLSAEVVVLTLGLVKDAPLMTQVMVLTIISLLMTVGVYGLVAAIVKIDDFGFYLMRRFTGLLHSLGRFCVRCTPHLMKLLSFVGTAAMFLVGGGILVHNVETLNSFEVWARALPGGDWFHHAVSPGCGMAAGFLCLPLVAFGARAVSAISGFGRTP